MKKFFILTFLAIFTIFHCTKSFATSYSEGISQSKPMALLIYASWADDLSAANTNFALMSQEFSQKYNFVKLDIASDEAKVFNKTFSIYPNLPYVMLYKNNGRFSRYLQKSCVLDKTCFQEKMEFFSN